MTGREVDDTIRHLDRVRRELIETEEIVDVAIVTWQRTGGPVNSREVRELFTTNSARLSSVHEVLEGGL